MRPRFGLSTKSTIFVKPTRFPLRMLLGTTPIAPLYPLHTAAAVELGSNKIVVVVMNPQLRQGERYDVYYRTVEQQEDSRPTLEETLKELTRLLASYKLDPRNVPIMGTKRFRNDPDLSSRVRTQFPGFQVLSEEDEVLLSYMNVTTNLEAERPCVMLDQGGGSLGVCAGVGNRPNPENAAQLPLGFNRFLGLLESLPLNSVDAWNQAVQEIRRQIRAELGNSNLQRLDSAQLVVPVTGCVRFLLEGMGQTIEPETRQCEINLTQLNRHLGLSERETSNLTRYLKAFQTRVNQADPEDIDQVLYEGRVTLIESVILSELMSFLGLNNVTYQEAGGLASVVLRQQLLGSASQLLLAINASKKF